MQHRYIATLKSEYINSGQSIELAIPDRRDSGSINVFCGPNHVGKSYLLKALQNAAAAYGTRNEYCELVVTGYLKPRLLAASLFATKDETGILKTTDSPDRTTSLHLRTLSKIIYRLLKERLPSTQKSALTTLQTFETLTLNNKSFRKFAFEHVPDQATSYLKSRMLPVFQKYTDSQLGVYRDGSTMQLAFRDKSGDCIFSEWSDGLRALACLESLLSSGNFDIVILDEIENHLHPFLISSAMEALKRSGAQVILTTHHPHVIFSRYADLVLYMEKGRPIEGKRMSMLRMSPLSSNFEKVASIYSMFASSDADLLTQIRYISSAADIKFYSELIASFNLEVRPDKANLLPDAQTQGLIDIVPLLEGRQMPLEFLDVGAGLGRTYLEFQKSPFLTRRNAKIKWTLWEPNPKLRAMLSARLKADKARAVAVCNDLLGLKQGSFDCVTVVNVLHELSPEEFATLISSIIRVMKSDGIVLIGEVYPLLHAERFAVPYDEPRLRTLFEKCGFNCLWRPINFWGGSGYWLALTKGTDLVDADLESRVLKEVGSAWRSIRDVYLRELRTHPGRFSDFLSYRSAIQALHVIGSVTAWERGIWGRRGD